MAKELLGDACAYIPAVRQGDKNRYIKIGIAMQDGDRISLKIDAFPLAGSGWTGWINIFAPRDRLDSRGSAVFASHPRTPASSGFNDFESEIPF